MKGEVRSLRTAAHFNPLEGLVGYALHRSARAVMSALAARFWELGLSTTSASILITIQANPGIAQIEICRIFGLQPANVTPVITELEKKSLVRRIAGAGRRLALSTTAAGDALCVELRREMDEFEEIIFGALGVKDRARMVGRLQSLGNRFQERARPRRRVARARVGP